MTAELDELVAETIGWLRAPLNQLVWAEEEIEAAQKRHPDAVLKISDSFMLLQSTHVMMDKTEFVYRAHVRELLDRVATGEDTRPGTWTEIVCACHEVSLTMPLHGVLFGLYCRAWLRAFPGKALDVIDATHYEALYGSQIDEIESDVRRKLTRSTRRNPKAA